MALALHRAGPAVLRQRRDGRARACWCLLAAEMNSTSGLGPVAAIGVAVALLAMMTLFPALLVIFGRWIFWPAIPHFGSPEPDRARLVGPYGPAHRPPPARGLGRHRGRPGRLLAWA